MLVCGIMSWLFDLLVLDRVSLCWFMELWVGWLFDLLVLDRVSLCLVCGIMSWLFDLVLWECIISSNVSQTDSGTLLFSMLCEKEYYEQNIPVYNSIVVKRWICVSTTRGTHDSYLTFFSNNNSISYRILVFAPNLITII